MTPSSYLFSFMDTTVPGFRTVAIAGSGTVTIDEGYYSFLDLISQLDSQLDLYDWAVSFNFGTGRVTLDGSAASADLTFSDRLGMYLGFDMPQTTTIGAGKSVVSARFPRGLCALVGAIWESVDIKRERVLLATRHKRGFGYIWGGAKLWKWTLTIHPGSIQTSEAEYDNSTGFNSFTTSQPMLNGFVTKGKVLLQTNFLQAAISESQPGGKLEGTVLELGDIKRISSAGYTAYQAKMLVCS